MDMIKLSIIIPYYNVAQYTDELLKCLAPQIREEIEVILVDDGSKVPYKTNYKWCKIYRQTNKGVSAARNKGLELAKGEYIAFIDADDIVAGNYVDRIIKKMPFDYLDMSWKSLPGGQQFEVKLTSDTDRLKNPSAVTRAFNRSVIGTIRFNENKQAAEDAEFIMNVCKPDMNVAVITDFMYFYRTYTPNSLTKRYLSGDMETKRIVYHYEHITADMTDLLEEVKRENEKHEVLVLTNQCDIPELNNYAKVTKPCKVRGMELRGEPYSRFTKILPAPEFDIAIYTSQKNINGIYTWIRAFCNQMSDKYSIAVIHDNMTADMVGKLLKVAYVKQNGTPIKCKTLLMMRIKDSIPTTIRYEQSIQIVHSAHINDSWKMPEDRDRIIPISNVVKESWNLTEEPIYNMTCPDDTVLHLISATRLTTNEKGKERMRKLCMMLNEAKIPYIWDCYSDITPDIKYITHCPMTTDIRTPIRNATYLVQLSDEEGFCYSIVEALEEGTPIIATPLKVLNELGIKDGVHGHIVPFDMNFDVKSLLNIPKVDYRYDNEPIKKQWQKILGKGTGNRAVTIRCTKRYRDMAFDRQIEEGELLTVNYMRAMEIISSGYAEEV